jgi:two-component system sensor histidine kinase BaeS
VFKTLRGQLVLSHILPSLVIIPLMGIALVYFLESRLILPGLENQLADDAVIFAGIARTQPQIFSDAQLAGSLIEDYELKTSTRVMLLDPQGILLASSDPTDDYRLNQVLDTEGAAKARLGITSRHLDFSLGLRGEVVDVFTPVEDDEGHLTGIVRLSYRFSTVEEQLMSLRYLIVGIIIVGSVSSAILGFLLALNIGHPIQQATESVLDLVRGGRTDPLPEQGPAEIKILQQAVNFLVEKLRELRQNRRRLLANLVHELGRPLGSLHMGIQVLRKGAKDDPQILDELLDGMETEARILRRLLDDLSHLHDQVIGVRELDLQTVALSQWLSGVLISNQEAAHRKGLNWDTDIAKDLPEIKLDPQRMAQAIGNLTTNAIKYTPRGGTVSVSAGESGESIWIRVSDTGPGIPVEEQEMIFEPFFRGTQRQRIKQGMGLGLHIARDYVTAHSGRLEVDSTPGSGSRFTIWLPKFVGRSDLSPSDKVLAREK